MEGAEHHMCVMMLLHASHTTDRHPMHYAELLWPLRSTDSGCSEQFNPAPT
jgi:hypothetical protein